MTQHRFTETDAARMLADGLRLAAQERGLSLREIGRRLGYRQPVVLSHMATGRVPVPVDRATEIAQQVGIPPDRFLDAVLRQHHPNVEWALITVATDPFVAALQNAVDMPFGSLSAEHRRVLQEVAKDSKPEERWLSIPEVAAVKLLRELYPHVSITGLSAEDCQYLRASIDLRNAINEQ